MGNCNFLTQQFKNKCSKQNQHMQILVKALKVGSIYISNPYVWNLHLPTSRRKIHQSFEKKWRKIAVFTVGWLFWVFLAKHPLFNICNRKEIISCPIPESCLLSDKQMFITMDCFASVYPVTLGTCPSEQLCRGVLVRSLECEDYAWPVAEGAVGSCGLDQHSGWR